MQKSREELRPRRQVTRMQEYLLYMYRLLMESRSQDFSADAIHKCPKSKSIEIVGDVTPGGHTVGWANPMSGARTWNNYGRERYGEDAAEEDAVDTWETYNTHTRLQTPAHSTMVCMIYIYYKYYIQHYCICKYEWYAGDVLATHSNLEPMWQRVLPPLLGN